MQNLDLCHQVYNSLFLFSNCIVNVVQEGNGNMDLHPHASRFHVPRDHHRRVQPSYQELAVEQHDGGGVVHGIDNYIRIYNTKRPYQSLDYQTPDEVYKKVS